MPPGGCRLPSRWRRQKSTPHWTGCSPSEDTDGMRRPWCTLHRPAPAEHPTRQWLDAYVVLDGHENSQEAADQVLSRIPGPAAYLSVERGDHRVVGIGLIVAAPGCGGVFCMATHPAHRRQGIATAILHVGARWAAARGAEELYLQVMDDNHAARRLYHRVGFRVSHTYHYRLKP